MTSTAKDIKELVGGLETIGQFIRKVTESKYAMYFITLLVFMILCATLLRTIMSRVPLFKGDGDKAVNSFGNTIAWCISILATLSIGWQMRNKGVDVIVNALAGPYGVFLIMLLVGATVYGAYSASQGQPQSIRMFWGLLVGGLLMAFLNYFAFHDSIYMWIFFVSVAIGGNIIALKHGKWPFIIVLIATLVFLGFVMATLRY